jgi:hypothetical protein
VGNAQALSKRSIMSTASAPGAPVASQITANPTAMAEWVAIIVFTVAFLAALVWGLATLHNKLNSRIGPKRAEWTMIGVFFAVPFLFVGLCFGLAFIADAIHGPYG